MIARKTITLLIVVLAIILMGFAIIKPTVKPMLTKTYIVIPIDDDNENNNQR